MSPSHPNRAQDSRPGRNPRPAEIVQLRDEMQMTQTEFGALVYRGRDIVAKWEAGERRMPPDTWEYLCLLHGFPAVSKARDEWIEGFR